MFRLSGIGPFEPIRYRIVIMPAILGVGAVALASYVILALEQRKFFDDYQLLREEICG